MESNMAEKKSFVQYVAESKVEYKYVLKFAVFEMTDKMIDCLEESLRKYDLKAASSFRKTPIQESPVTIGSMSKAKFFKRCF